MLQTWIKFTIKQPASLKCYWKLETVFQPMLRNAYINTRSFLLWPTAQSSAARQVNPRTSVSNDYRSSCQTDNNISLWSIKDKYQDYIDRKPPKETISLKKNICEDFNNYFDLIDHNLSTRNNQYSSRLPKTRLQSTHKAFFYQAAPIYNELPLEIRKIDNQA